MTTIQAAETADEEDTKPIQETISILTTVDTGHQKNIPVVTTTVIPGKVAMSPRPMIIGAWTAVVGGQPKRMQEEPIRGQRRDPKRRRVVLRGGRRPPSEWRWTLKDPGLEEKELLPQ